MVKNWIVLQSWFEETGVQNLRKTKFKEKVFFPTVTKSKTKECPRVGILFSSYKVIFLLWYRLYYFGVVKKLDLR